MHDTVSVGVKILGDESELRLAIRDETPQSADVPHKPMVGIQNPAILFQSAFHSFIETDYSYTTGWNLFAALSVSG
ncbi:hypothetical protein ACFQFQ_21505 [Sulfitobacter porphyrae]|uniref:Uncharacterized protein n=1 Tax=Sulfitobacter porphyrae TaxID=1246864 RepID=A0ABW2B6T8_9RHOB|nr:hypothetical protein GCM10007928_42100 [Sulfitobacter porphyrae]